VRLLLLALVLVGCSAPRPVYVDADAPEGLVEAVAGAVDQWNAAAGFPVLEARSVDVAGAAHLVPGSIVVVEKDDPKGGRDTDAHTYSAIIVTRVQVRTARTTEDGYPLRWLVAHELGHALGLRHHEGECNVMGQWWQPCDDAEALGLDEEQLRRVRGVGMAGNVLSL